MKFFISYTPQNLLWVEGYSQWVEDCGVFTVFDKMGRPQAFAARPDSEAANIAMTFRIYAGVPVTPVYEAEIRI